MPGEDGGCNNEATALLYAFISLLLPVKCLYCWKQLEDLRTIFGVLKVDKGMSPLSLFRVVSVLV